MTNRREPDFARQRNRLVDRIAQRETLDAAVLKAIGAVPREAFVPAELQDAAYRDSALPIGRGQTISQPSVVALMTEALCLSAQDRVLEIGSGSGYGAAILAELAGEVHTIEQDEFLAEEAREKLDRLGFANVRVHHADGTLGWPERAPYDAISVTACCDEVPCPLVEQLSFKGRMVLPLGSEHSWQKLATITKTGDSGYDQEEIATVKFVPMV